MSQKRMLALGKALLALSFLFIFTGLYLEFEARDAFSDPLKDVTIIAGGDDKVIISTTDDDVDEDKIVKVYLFYGDGCDSCSSAKNFFNSIEEEYGKFFDVVSYEVLFDDDNAKLLSQIEDIRNENLDDFVPYILIGNKSWTGYNADYNEEIIDTIMKLHSVSPDERYDILSLVAEDNKKEDDSSEEKEPLPPVHTHSYSSVVVSPTCTEGGYTTFSCSCGHSYTDNITSAYGHNYTSVVVAPTTESQGYTLHTCKNCGSSYKDSYTDKLPVETPPVVEVSPEPSIEEKNDTLRRAIENTYGIVVKYGSETNGYVAGTESTVSISDPLVIQSGLNQLNSALALYPNDFFKEFSDLKFKLKVYLVQNYSSSNVTGITEFLDRNVTISISMNFPFAESFHHEVYHYMEAFIEKSGGEFSIWNTYNPSDFTYGSADTSLSFSVTSAPNAPFVNNYAQSDDDEDRASTFEYMTASSKASCYNSTEYPIWKKSSYMALMIDTYFDTVDPSVIDYWERFIY